MTIKSKLFMMSFLLILVLIVVSMDGCSSLPAPSGPMLASITLTPLSPPNLPVGSILQFTATGTYSDGSTIDITHDAKWFSDDATIAIDSLGIATGVVAGTTSIKATLDGVTSPDVRLTVTPVINPFNGTYGTFYLGLVSEVSTGETLAGDGCYDDTGDFIILINNKSATNPNYSQLVDFLQNDKIDEYPYLVTNKTFSSYYGRAESLVDLKNIQNIIVGKAKPNNPDVCADFAERLHNDAEMAGIRCAFVSLDLSTGRHGIDAFQTTDRGLIFIDDTGPFQEPHSLRAVKTVDLKVGSEYTAVSLFPEAGWEDTYQSLGIVNKMQVTWDGTWNN